MLVCGCMNVWVDGQMDEQSQRHKWMSVGGVDGKSCVCGQMIDLVFE